jgi:hypothetical protein
MVYLLIYHLCLSLTILFQENKQYNKDTFPPITVIGCKTGKIYPLTPHQPSELIDVRPNHKVVNVGVCMISIKLESHAVCLFECVCYETYLLK